MRKTWKSLLASCLALILCLTAPLASFAEMESTKTDLPAVVEPSKEPTAEPSEEPTKAPTAEPSEEPTEAPTAEPSEEPTEAPTEEPSEEPTEAPTAEPSEEPTEAPTEEPSEEPSEAPTEEPSVEPTEEPTETPASGIVTMDMMMSDAAMVYALPGAVTLTTGQTTNMNIGTGIMTDSNAYGSFTMSTAGKLSLSFRSAGKLAGNLRIVIRSVNDSDKELWSWSGAMAVGQVVTFSDYVEAGSYDIIISRTDASDANGYILAATPSVSNSGEAGSRNNGASSAAGLTLGGTSKGIVSLQDQKFGRKDYYSFTLSSPSKVVLSMTNIINAQTSFRVYSSDLSTELTNLSVDAAACPNENSNVTYHKTGWFSAGTYYVVVSGNATGRYSVGASATTVSLGEKEGNSTPSAAYASNNTLSLTATSYVTGMMSETDNVDYYYFNVAKSAQTVSARVQLQFPSAGLALCRVDGTVISGTDFSVSNTGASENSSYVATLKDTRLDAGNYYLRVTRKGNSVGLYGVRVTSKLTASHVTGSVNGNAITMQGVYAGGTTTPKLYRYNLYLHDSLANIDTLLLTKDLTTNDKYTAYVTCSGTYLIQYVIWDGKTWTDCWATVQATVQEMKITQVAAKVDAQNNIKCDVTYTGPGSIIGCVFTLYRGGVKIDSFTGTNQTSHTFKAPAGGTYSVQYAATMDNIRWTDGWVNNIEVKGAQPSLPLVVNPVSVNSDSNGNINCSVTTSNGTGKLVYGNWVLYLNNQVVQQYGTTTLNHTFKVNKDGHYLVEFVASDGRTWADGWGSADVVVSGYQPLTVTSVTATASNAGIVTLKATTQGGYALQQGNFYIMTRSGSVIAKLEGKNRTATWEATQAGDFLVEYVAFDGVTWKDGWGSVNVKKAFGPEPLNVSLKLTPANSGKLTSQATITGGNKLKQANYYLYQNNKIIDAFYSVNATSHDFYVNQAGDYLVQVVLYDGKTWKDAWQSAHVNYTPSGNVELKLSDVKVSLRGTTLTCSVTTNDSRALTSATFYLYRGNTVIAKMDGKNRTATFTNVSAAGNYLVEFVASDGRTWKDSWGSFKIGGETLKINALKAVRDSNNILTCTASITNQSAIQAAYFHVYNGTKLLGSWKWEYGTSYLTHAFNLGSKAATHVQYVVYDGNEWKDMWTEIK